MFKLTSSNDKTQYYKPVICDVMNAERRIDIFSDSAFRAEIVGLLTTMDEASPIKHITLDVFDTVVLRNEKAESRRFWEMAGRVAERIGQDTARPRRVHQSDVYVARIMATRASYRTRRPVNGCREGSLTSIYDGIAASLGLAPSLAPELLDIEIAYEIENTVRNPLVSDILDFAENRGAGVSMISDMYMHAPQILRIIEGHFGEETARLGTLISSGDTSVSKRSGHLFDEVVMRESISPCDLLHIGDSLVGDFRSPIERGCRAVLIPHAEKEIDAIRRDHREFERELEAQGLALGDWIKPGV